LDEITVVLPSNAKDILIHFPSACRAAAPSIGIGKKYFHCNILPQTARPDNAFCSKCRLSGAKMTFKNIKNNFFLTQKTSIPKEAPACLP
jgi:hypothetical protein